MIEHKIYFYSEGYKLEGSLYFPDKLEAGEKLPAIIPNSGYQGFNEFYPKLFAEKFTQAGYACLGFDYRGFGESEGKSGHVILKEQVQDINNAITFLQQQEYVDADRIGILGWGMGASNVIDVASQNKKVSAVAALNGFYNGSRWLQSVHSYKDYIDIIKTVEKDNINNVLTGESKLIDTFLHYPLDPATQDEVNVELTNIKHFGKPVELTFTKSILELNVEKNAGNISPCPTFIAHGNDNLLHPYEEAKSLYNATKSPKTLYTINGKHNDFMYAEHPEFLKLIKKLQKFFDTHLTTNKLDNQCLKEDLF